MPFSDRNLRALLWCGLILFSATAFWGTRPPSTVGSDAAPNVFSAVRAMSHLPFFAARPHPIGSTENHAARDYLGKVLLELGGEVKIENTVGVHARGRFVRMGNVQNIMARFPGTANRRAVMLVAHYDSVPAGPGAADDGAGVVAILETVHALRAGSAHQNDLIVLFTDGEEPGLLGAAGFTEDRPDLAKRVGVILNLEARGSSGPALMFETSQDNGWLIPEFAKAAPYPMASSLMYAVYQLLPNDTDLSELKNSGVAALNFAFTETFENYHSPRDTAENLDPRSVQHLGANVLGLTRHFLTLPLSNLRKADFVYFDWAGSRLIYYPGWLIWVMAVLVFVLVVLTLMRGRRKKETGFRAWSLVAFFLLLLATGGGMFLSWSGVKLISLSFQRGDTPSNQCYLAGLLLIGFVLGGAILRGMTSKLGYRPLHVGLITTLAAISIAVCFLLPGGSYLFQWPAFFGLVSCLLCLWAKTPKESALISLPAAVPTILILTPLVYLFFVNLDLNAVSLLACALLLCILLAAAWPLFDFIMGDLRKFSMTITLLALAAIAYGVLLARPSARHPEGDHLLYSLSTDQGKAEWVSYDAAPDQWTCQFLGQNPEKKSAPAYIGSNRVCLIAPAPPLPLPPPVASLTNDEREGDLRRMRLHIRSARGASTFLLRLSTEADVETMAFNGRSKAVHTVGKGPWTLRCEGVQAEGADLDLQLRGTQPLHLWMADSSRGLPEPEGRANPKRPDDLIAEADGDVTLVAREENF